MCPADGQYGFNLVQILGRERNLSPAQQFGQMGGVFRAGDGQHVFAARDDPRNRKGRRANLISVANAR